MDKLPLKAEQERQPAKIGSKDALMSVWNKDGNPKKDNRGQWRTYSLFVEHKNESYEVFWTLAEEDGELPSLRQLYVSYDHVPGNEYDFAKEVIGSWDLWQVLCDSFLKVHIEKWREELEIRIKAGAIKSLITASKDVKGITAAKYLADRGYSPTRGRPSKEEKARKLKIDAEAHRTVAEEAARVGLKMIKS